MKIWRWITTRLFIFCYNILHESDDRSLVTSSPGFFLSRGPSCDGLGEGVALLGWASSALKGTSGTVSSDCFRRPSQCLPYLANNVLYLILPSGRVRNLAQSARKHPHVRGENLSGRGHPLHR